MEIKNEFTVNVPIERAWAVLTDLAVVASCLPGAVLSGHDGETYSGKVKVKVGPVVSEYSGTAVFVEKDQDHHRAVIEAQGRNSGGSGGASAQIVETLRPDGDKTIVSVDTDLSITGKIAQFGKSAIVEVSEKLMGQFVEALETTLTTALDPSEVDESPRDNSDRPPSDSTTRPAPQPDKEAIDLMSVARGSLVKRIVPLVVVLVVVVVVVYLVAD